MVWIILINVSNEAITFLLKKKKRWYFGTMSPLLLLQCLLAVLI